MLFRTLLLMMVYMPFITFGQCVEGVDLVVADTVCLATTASFQNNSVNVQEYIIDFYSGDLNAGVIGTDDMGNVANTIDAPVGITIAKENNQYYGFTVITNPIAILRTDFGNNLTSTTLPNLIDLGNPDNALATANRGLRFVENRAYTVSGAGFSGSSLTTYRFQNGLSNPPDTAISYQSTNGTLYEYKSPRNVRPIMSNTDSLMLFVCNQNYISLVSPGTNLDNNPILIRKIDSLNTINTANWAVDLALIRICDEWLGYAVLNNDDIVLLNFGSHLSNKPVITSFGNYSAQLSSTAFYCEVVQAEGEVHLFVQLNAGDVVHFNFGETGKSAPIANTYSNSLGNGTVIGFDLVKSNSAWYLFGANRSTKTIYKSTFANNVDDPSAISQTLANQIYPYTFSGDYSIEITGVDTLQNISSQLDTIYMQDAIIPNFDYNSRCLDDPISFTDLSSSTTLNATNWEWMFGDGGSSVLQNPDYQYNTAGTYEVSFEITADNGCVSSTTDSISVSDLKPEFPDFSYLPTTVCENTLVSFFDSTEVMQDSVNQYFWDFGNGLDSDLQNPTTQYDMAGNQIVSLTVSGNFGCDTTVAQNITVQPGPTPAFTAQNTCLGDVTQFFDASSTNPPSNIISWEWYFGGTDSSTLQNPTFVFDSAGVKTVSLTVTTNSGCIATVSENIVIESLPEPEFGYNIICAGTDIPFTDLTVGNIDSWLWTTSTETSNQQNPTFSFPNQGFDTVSLTVTTVGGCVAFTQEAVEVFPEFIANFSFDQTCLGNPVQFSDETNSFSIVDWQWSFGVPNAFSIQQNPSYNYATADTFTVSMTVSNAIGCISQATEEIIITEPPVVQWVSDSLCVDQNLLFEDASIVAEGDSIVDYTWMINGDEFTGVSSVSYSFSDTGSYNVSLTILTQNGCSETLSKEVVVNSNPVADFSFNPSYGIAPIDVSFTNQSAGASNFNWDFGDGIGTSQQVNPIYNYSSNAVYNVALVAVNEFGCTNRTVRELALVPSELDLEMSTITLQNQIDPFGNTVVSTQISFTNVGTRAINNADFIVQLNDEVALQETWNGLLAVGSTAIFTFTSSFVISQNVEAKAICVTAQNVNDNTETNFSNNKICTLVTGNIQTSAPYPNPAINSISIDLVTRNSGVASYTVYEVSGKKVFKTANINIQKGYNPIHIDLGNVLSGSYYVVLNYLNEDYILPFVISNK